MIFKLFQNIKKNYQNFNGYQNLKKIAFKKKITREWCKNAEGE